MAAQLVHAAGESFRPGASETFAVALAARNEDHLIELERRLIQLGIPHHAVREPDEPWKGALMAIGIMPVEDRRALKKITGSLPLLR